MRIGIINSSIGDFGQKGFYNSQEIGLAKSLGQLCDEIIVYKAISVKGKYCKETINGCNNASLIQIPTKQIGNNGIIETKFFDTHLDVMIDCADIQFSVPKIYKWAKKNSILFIPYIGVLESHSPNQIIRAVTNLLAKRNFALYKKSVCLVKTPEVEHVIRKRGVKKVLVTPVGLDLDVLNRDFARVSVIDLKKKYGYKDDDRIILFVGRMTNEKQPVKMIDIFSKLAKEDENFRLLMIGIGELRTQVENSVLQHQMKNRVRLIDKIPNSEIWELYRFADAFVNLNKQEIFGMAILEAMYYGCKVIAWDAPGPSFIIEDGVSGWLVKSEEAVIKCLLDPTDVTNAAHERILNNFTWRKVALAVKQIVEEEHENT